MGVYVLKINFLKVNFRYSLRFFFTWARMLTVMVEPIVIKALSQSRDTLEKVESLSCTKGQKTPIFIDFVLENGKKLHKPYSERLHKFWI